MPRVGLYQILMKIWSSPQAPFVAPAQVDNGDGDGREAIAQRRLATLTPRPRQALLLTAMEGFSRDEAAAILEADEEEIAGLLASAIAETDTQTPTHLLLHPDPPTLAMPLACLVQGLATKDPAPPRTPNT